jgi:protein SCO1/2
MDRKIAIRAAAALAALLGATAWMALAPGRAADCPGGSVAGAAIGGPFELVSETGETVTEAEVIDGPALLYFGYTFCPDVCPFDAARNADAVDLLAEMGHAVKPVFISVDPGRDTPEVLAEYTDYLHPQMLGLTGSEAQVKAAAQAYKVYHGKRDSDDPDFYFVDHTGLSYLVTPEDGLLAFFRGAPGAGGSEDGTSAQDLAAAAACHLDRR